jgi:hypothetical protein
MRNFDQRVEDEYCFWLEIIQARNWLKVDIELREANEQTAIFDATLKTMNNKLNDAKSKMKSNI